MPGGIIIIPGVLIFAALAPAIPARELRNVQYDPQQKISVGSLLVAKEKLGDPNFAEAVVLIVDRDEDGGTAGLVINRPTDVTLSRVFPDIKHASADPIYLGGPVGITVGQALLRLSSKKDDAVPILGDVYRTASRKLIEKSVAAGTEPSKFRLFFGYAGWAPGQLEAEVRLGAWSVLKGQAKIVFDQDPESLWDRLNRQTQWQVAKLPISLLQGVQVDKASAKQPARVVEIESVMNPSQPRTSVTAIEHHIFD